MKWILTIVVVLFSFSTNGQDSLLIGHQALNKIYETKGPLFFSVNANRTYKILNEEGFFSKYSHVLIKHNNDLFIRLDGTGRVYKVKNKIGDTLLVNRIDSTHFFGYNGAAYEFIYRDTIMSLGGFGFWKKNGQLRYYSHQNHEWDIIPLNLEIPVAKESTYFDIDQNEIYILKLPFVDLATNKKDESYLVYKLEITKREYQLLGELNPELIKLFPIGVQYMSLQLPSLKSELMIFEGGKIYLFDFVKNQVYKLINPAIEKTIFASSKGDYVDFAYENNGKLFFSKSNDPKHQLDSIPISFSDFTKLNQKLYTPNKQLNTIFYWIGGILLVSILFFVYWKINKRKSSRVNEDISFYDTKENKFKETELDLIEKIYNRSLEGKSYSVEDINAVLGLSKKSLEIQKKIRTETINRINHRFKIIFNTEDELIERIRLEEDRRFYKYIISEENGKKALGI
jgi:hypothetical protein